MMRAAGSGGSLACPHDGTVDFRLQPAPERGQGQVVLAVCGRCSCAWELTVVDHTHGASCDAPPGKRCDLLPAPEVE